MMSSHLFLVCLVFFPLSLCLARWFWPDLINERHDHTTTAVCISLQWSGGGLVVWLLLDLGTDFLVCNMVFVWDVSRHSAVESCSWVPWAENEVPLLRTEQHGKFGKGHNTALHSLPTCCEGPHLSSFWLVQHSASFVSPNVNPPKNAMLHETNTFSSSWFAAASFSASFFFSRSSSSKVVYIAVNGLWIVLPWKDCSRKSKYSVGLIYYHSNRQTCKSWCIVWNGFHMPMVVTEETTHQPLAILCACFSYKKKQLSCNGKKRKKYKLTHKHGQSWGLSNIYLHFFFKQFWDRHDQTVWKVNHNWQDNRPLKHKTSKNEMLSIQGRTCIK